MRKPNLFIVGAPKCGTTALRDYLQSHPNVFMSRQKEPQFFASDVIGNLSELPSFAQYIRLFAKASDDHKIIGEASTRYLLSKIAIHNIFDFNKEAKLIAMVRNPVDLVYSFHSQQLYDLNEDVVDFETAWRLQESRKLGMNIPDTCINPLLLYYAEIGKLGEQIDRMLSIFPREQVQIVVFDDFVSDTLSVYKNVLEFLCLPYDGRIEFPRVNANKAHRYKWLARLLYRSPPPIKIIVDLIKRISGVSRTGLASTVLRGIAVPQKRKPLSSEFRKELASFFRDDVILLSHIIERDLSYWLND